LPESPKILKKTVRVLAILLLSLTLSIIGFALSLRNSSVQTWVTGRVAAYLSSQLGAKISIQRVDIELFKTLVLEGVYVEDQKKDTILYAGSIDVVIGILSFKNHLLSVKSIALSEADIQLKTYENETDLNLQFIIDYLSSSDTTKPEETPWMLNISNVEIKNSRFRLKNLNYPAKERGINYDDMEARI
jgi:hypothetical protein